GCWREVPPRARVPQPIRRKGERPWKIGGMDCRRPTSGRRPENSPVGIHRTRGGPPGGGCALRTTGQPPSPSQPEASAPVAAVPSRTLPARTGLAREFLARDINRFRTSVHTGRLTHGFLDFASQDGSPTGEGPHRSGSPAPSWAVVCRATRRSNFT